MGLCVQLIEIPQQVKDVNILIEQLAPAFCHRKCSLLSWCFACFSFYECCQWLLQSCKTDVHTERQHHSSKCLLFPFKIRAFFLTCHNPDSHFFFVKFPQALQVTASSSFWIMQFSMHSRVKMACQLRRDSGLLFSGTKTLTSKWQTEVAMRKQL